MDQKQNLEHVHSQQPIRLTEKNREVF